jgi:predicted Zn-dependent protease
MKRVVLILLTCFITAGCTAASLPPVSGDFRLEEDEKRLFQRAREEEKVINESGLIYEDVELEDYLNQIATRLQPPEILQHISFRIKVINDPSLNAFSLPNGALYIHTGILARMDNEAQLATLLAHEMTHATYRHAVKAFRKVKSNTDFNATVQGTMTGFGEMGDLTALLGSTGLMAAVTGYSRDLETEADTVGLEVTVKAGYSPVEALKLFEHLKKETEEEGIKEPFFFGTHPKLQKRLENYENFLGKQSQWSGTDIKNTEIFLTKVNGIILDNAWLDLKAGRFFTAERGAEKYLTIKPKDARAYFLLGEIFRQRAKEEDTRKAKAYYKRAISIDPSYPDPHKGIGLIYYKEGEKTLAKRSFESFLSLSPHAPDRTFIQEYLKQCNE